MKTSPPRDAMRLVRQSGGRIDHCLTRYDRERGGRVMELHVFWPGASGYADGPSIDADEYKAGR